MAPTSVNCAAPPGLWGTGLTGVDSKGILVKYKKKDNFNFVLFYVLHRGC